MPTHGTNHLHTNFAQNQQQTVQLPWAFIHLVLWRQKSLAAHSA
jgi:hypothetical protein